MKKKFGEKIHQFMRRQVAETRRGGVSMFLHKIYRLLSFCVALPIVAVVVALRPFRLIRFGELSIQRIGHFALNTELYMCMRDAGISGHNLKTLDLFYYANPKFVSNQQLKRMWERLLHVSVLAEPVGNLLCKLTKSIPILENHRISLSTDRDLDVLLSRTTAHLSFTPEEESLGGMTLKAIGIPEGSPFVCCHARDSAYLKSLSIYQHHDFSYHDYRDANIQNFLPAMEELTRRGYFILRMGSKVKEALTTTNTMIIDYATQFRTDFMDIYLGAKCAFFVGCTAGITSIPWLFRRPVAVVNYIPLEYFPTLGPQSLVIPKKLWLEEEQRFLTFREIFDSGIGKYFHTQQYEQDGITIIENTPEEITALVIEMDERLKGTYQNNREDEDRQLRFRSLFRNKETNRIIECRMGREFLRQNTGLFE